MGFKGAAIWLGGIARKDPSVDIHMFMGFMPPGKGGGAVCVAPAKLEGIGGLTDKVADMGELPDNVPDMGELPNGIGVEVFEVVVGNEYLKN